MNTDKEIVVKTNMLGPKGFRFNWKLKGRVRLNYQYAGPTQSLK